MKSLEYNINIEAPRKKVWNTMLQPETYKKWTQVAWPGSQYEGKWREGEEVRFTSPGHGGTLAKIEEHIPYEKTFARHIAIINKDGTEDRESEIAKNWIGITESYHFIEKQGQTQVKVNIETTPEWEKMFDEGWPVALQKLKEVCEE